MEGVWRVTPRAPQVTGCESHEYARPTCVGRFPLNGIENLVDRQHSRQLPTPNEPTPKASSSASTTAQRADWKLASCELGVPTVIVPAWVSASAPRAGATPPARASGTASSTLLPGPREPAPPTSTSCASTPNTSTPSK